MKKFIFAKDRGILHKIFLDDILYLTSSKDYVLIKVVDRRFIVHTTMTSMEKRLETHNFCRTSRAHIVNMEKIDRIQDHEIQIGNERVPIGGRMYRKNFYEKLKEWQV